MTPVNAPFSHSLPLQLQPFCDSQTSLKTPCQSKEELEERLCNQPQLLISFMKRAAFERGWIQNESSLAKRLFRHLSYLVRKKALPLQEGVEAMSFFIEKAPETLPFIVESDFSLQELSLKKREVSEPGGVNFELESKTVLKISTLAFMRLGRWFQAYFMGYFKEEELTETPYYQFASEVDLPTLKRLAGYLQSDQESYLNNMRPTELWMALRQCHLWQLPSALNLLQRKLIPFIQQSSSASFHLQEASFWELKRVQLHCLEVLHNKDLLLSLDEDDSFRATLIKSSEKTLSVLRDLSPSLSHITLLEEELGSTSLQRTLASLPRLENMTLKIPFQSLSAEAIETLACLPPLKALKIVFTRKLMANGTKVTSVASSKVSPCLTQIERLEFTVKGKKPDTLSSIALGFITQLPRLSQLTLAGSPFVNDSFISSLTTQRPPLTTQRPPLRHLHLGQCNNISEIALKRIPSAFPDLKSLNLQGHSLWNYTILPAILNPLTKLEYLSLQGCSRLPEGVLAPLTQELARLRELNLSGVRNLSENDLQAVLTPFSKLERLHIAHCPNLRYLSFLKGKLPRLQELTVSPTFFEKLEEMELQNLRKTYPSLRRLTIEGEIPPLWREILALSGF